MDGNSPLLTGVQRDVLKTLATGDAADRRELSRLRSRVRSIIADFPILLTLPPDERQKVFEDLETHREYLRQKWDKPGVTLGGDGVIEEPEGPLSGHAMRPADEPDQVEEEAVRFHNGVVAALAFLYAGVDDPPSFESMLEDAIRESRRADGKVAVDVDVNISMEREEDRDELVERWGSGDIDEEALKSLLKSDPVAMFEAGLADDQDQEGTNGEE